MQWLTQNPVADMPGPDFLIVYGVLTALTILFVKLKARRLDPTLDAELPPLPIPGKFSPIEVAYLGGNLSKVFGTVLFSLWDKGFLRAEIPEKGKPYLVREDSYPDVDELSPIERAVFLPIDGTRSNARAITEHLAAVREFGKELEPSLKDELIMMPDDARSAARQLFWQSAPWLIMVGGYKLIIALEKGKHNVGFLVLFLFFAIAGLAVAITLPRLTRRGSDYLERMSFAFKGNSNTSIFALGDDGYPADEKAVLGVALFGLTALSGTPLASSWQWLGAKQAVAGCSGASGAFVGCGGSSCGGGGGCGGGGCGGGGCGGCGG